MKNILTLILLTAVLGTAFAAVRPASAEELTASNTLTANEEEGLVFMREEEKLARDVYVALYATWGLPIFQNIANSESTHCRHQNPARPLWNRGSCSWE